MQNFFHSELGGVHIHIGHVAHIQGKLILSSSFPQKCLGVGFKGHEHVWKWRAKESKSFQEEPKTKSLRSPAPSWFYLSGKCTEKVVSKEMSLNELKIYCQTYRALVEVRHNFMKCTNCDNWDEVEKRFGNYAEEKRLMQFVTLH